MHNPLRSEADAFRWVVVIGAGRLAVIVLTLLTRPPSGSLWAALLIGFGVGVAYRTARGSLPRSVEVTHGGDGRLPAPGRRQRDGRRRGAAGGDPQPLPRARQRDPGRHPGAAASRAAHWASDIDEATELARQRMELSLIEIDRLGLKAKGEIGDSDPNVAIEDALRVFPADEILISTHPAGSLALARARRRRAGARGDRPAGHPRGRRPRRPRASRQINPVVTFVTLGAATDETFRS